ncbi:biopolymer transporter ExbD [Craterilacuibacter sp. RT1T]|uniref:ExbD/TolR family protein n=1 Tax=Craterilacuibacter sp. RT1T TaxID=2942211 RepID=UPI0020C08866|nr:biopolymer transporter ExbD [Craterilacuibacter sp. RT1T]MCL6263496.1 biopolymer transporter ExbD [Craterilacuibacter sp. RT1T]
MAFGNFSEESGAPMAEINMTPLVDVMLVLLVVFIVTAPLLSNAVRVDLPRAAAAAHQDKPEQIRLAIDAAGALWWNDAPLSEAAFAARLQAAVASHPDVELHVRADKAVRYELVAKALASAQQAGVSRIGFITQQP